MHEQIVLDSYALLGFLKNENCAEKVDEKFKLAYSGKSYLYMSMLNLGEVFYILARERNQEFAIKIEAEIFRLPIEFVEADWEMIREAAMIKAKYPMAFADCFAAALALRKCASIMTGDPEFYQIKSLFDIIWLEK